MNSLARAVQTKSTLNIVNEIKVTGHWYKLIALTIITPMQIHNVLNSVKRIFLGDENQRFLFIYNQKAPGRPKLNQLANKAV